MTILQRFAIPILLVMSAMHEAVAEPIQSQMNIGTGGIIVNHNGSGPLSLTQGNLNCYSQIPGVCKQSGTSDRGRRDSLFVKLERYLMATNPTELEVFTVGLEQWYGDDEMFVTIHIRNISKLPAENVEVGILTPRETGQKDSKRLGLKKSKALMNIEIGSKSTLFLSQDIEIKLPIAARSELLANLDLNSIMGYEFLGVGMSPEVPQVMQDSFKQKAIITDTPESPGSGVAFSNRSLTIFLRYRTVFDQKRVKPFPLYFYFGKDLNQH
jgi:hypothetical protein